MERENLKNRISELRSGLKSLCTDKVSAAKMINELIEVQRQIDIEPTELYVPVKDVIATYDFGAFSLVRCKTCIIFKTTGYRLVAKPLYNQNEDGGVLYSQLAALCEMKERYNEVGEEERNLWDLVFNLSVTILSLPIDAFGDDEFLFDVATHIVKKKKEMYEKIPSKVEHKDETEADEISNDKFRQEVEAAEEMKKEADKNA